jgi:hypothetical protein
MRRPDFLFTTRNKTMTTMRSQKKQLWLEAAVVVTRRLAARRETAAARWSTYKQTRSDEALEDYLRAVRRCSALDSLLREGAWMEEVAL